MPSTNLNGVISIDGKQLQLPSEVTTSLTQGINDGSVVAQLGQQAPFTFRDSTNISFPDNVKAEIVNEGDVKSPTTVQPTLTHAVIKKAQATIRLTSEDLWADADNGLNLQNIVSTEETNALARQLDSLVLHGVSDLAGNKLTDVQSLTDLVPAANKITEGKDAMTSLDNLESTVNTDWVPSGLALNRTFANELRTMRNSESQRIYPELTLDLKGNVDGINTAVSKTVDPELAILGDWSQIRWGYVNGINMTVIPYGSPDGGPDLQHVNMVAIRTEVVYAFQILHPEAFALLEPKASGSASSSK